MTAFDTLKDTSTVDTTADLEHLITQMALIARAGKMEYGLTTDQVNDLNTRFFSILDAYPSVHETIMTAVKNKDRYWETPCDTVLKQLSSAGILAVSLGV